MSINVKLGTVLGVHVVKRANKKYIARALVKHSITKDARVSFFNRERTGQ
jgi:hypothetical protein